MRLLAVVGPAARCAPLLATRVAAPLCAAVAGEYRQLQPGGPLQPAVAIFTNVVQPACLALKLLISVVLTAVQARPRTCAAAVVVLCCAWRPWLPWLQRSWEAATLAVRKMAGKEAAAAAREATAAARAACGAAEAAEAAAAAAAREAAPCSSAVPRRYRHGRRGWARRACPSCCTMARPSSAAAPHSPRTW